MKTEIIATKGSRQWQGIPGIERSQSGRLWCTFFSGGPKEPDPANLILLCSSADDGTTWSEPSPIVDPPGATRAYDPALWRDPSGRMWLFYNVANLERRRWGLWAMHTDDPDAPHPSWSDPQPIPMDVPFCFRLNKPTVLASGAWLLPVTHASQTPDDWFAFDRQLQGVAISHDQGCSWTLRGAIEAPRWALENMVVQHRDGSLTMLIRTNDGVLWSATSSDDGSTWSHARRTGLVNPGSRFFIRRLTCGRLLLINTPRPDARRGLYAYLGDNENDGRFTHRLLLDERDAVSYPDAVEGPSGVIRCVHDRDRQGVGEIILHCLEVDEILEQPLAPQDVLTINATPTDTRYL